MDMYEGFIDRAKTSKELDDVETFILNAPLFFTTRIGYMRLIKAKRKQL